MDSTTLYSPTLAPTTKPIYLSTSFFCLTFSLKIVTTVYPETLGELYTTKSSELHIKTDLRELCCEDGWWMELT
jgi:hypothetical protein